MDNMITELTNSIKAALYQRVSSPIYGTYIITWLIYNWKLSLPLIFSNKNFDLRFSDFKTGMLNEDLTLALGNLLYPLLITVSLLVIQPISQRFVYIYSEWNKSKGLKKRDEYASETMLTLEQSNELRASVKNIQQFNQDVIKNKDIEVNEYKKQIEGHENSAQKSFEESTQISEILSQTESEKSELEKELAQHKTDLNTSKDKLKRLFGILLKQRKIYQDKTAKQKGLYANRDLIKFLPLLVGSTNIGKLTMGDLKTIDSLISLSKDKEWIDMCHLIMINNFGSSVSYDMADKYFQFLIKPHVKDFSDENLTALVNTMNNNLQIKDRGRASIDMDIVNEVIKSKSTF